MKTRTIEIEVTEVKMSMLDAIYYEAPFLFRGRWYKYDGKRLYSLCPRSLEPEQDEDWKCGKDGFYFLDAEEQLSVTNVDVDLEEVVVLKDENGNYWVDWEAVTEYWETDDPEDWDMEEEPIEEEIEVPEMFGQILSVLDDLFEKSIEESYR
jgi:hypothetical protein